MKVIKRGPCKYQCLILLLPTSLSLLCLEGSRVAVSGSFSCIASSCAVLLHPAFHH